MNLAYLRLRKEDEMNTEKRINKNDCGMRRRKSLTRALALLSVVSFRRCTDPLPARAWESMCRCQGNKRDYGITEKGYLGPPEQRREPTRGSLLLSSGDVMNRYAEADGTTEIDWFLNHTSSGCQRSCQWLVDNVLRKGDRYGEQV